MRLVQQCKKNPCGINQDQLNNLLGAVSTAQSRTVEMSKVLPSCLAISAGELIGERLCTNPVVALQPVSQGSISGKCINRVSAKWKENTTPEFRGTAYRYEI